jgi:hypothetical protein
MTASGVLRAYASFVVRRRRLVVAIMLGLTLFLASRIGRLHVEVDPDRNLPQQHPYIQSLNEMHRVFGDKNLVLIGLVPRDGKVFSPAFLRKVKEINDRLSELPGVVKPLLQSVASPFVKDIQPTADGITVQPVMAEAPKTQAEADQVRARLLDNPSYVGTLVAPDESALAILMTIEVTPQLPAWGELHKAVLDVLAAADDGTFQSHLSGPVVFASALGTYAGRMVYYFPLALLVIGLVHYDAFRTLQAIFLPLLTALLAVVWAVGLMGLLGVPLDPYNTTTPILILAVAAGHAVQILKRYYEELARLHDSEAAVVESITRVGGVMIAAGTIAALSFASLGTFGTATIRTFGVFTALGIASTLVIELTLIPALRAALPTPRLKEVEREARTHPWLDDRLRRLAGFVSGRGAVWIVLGAIGLIGVSALLARRIEVDTSFKREFRQSSSVYQDDEVLNRKLAGTSTLVFLVEGPGEGAIAEPAALAAIDRFERRMEALPGVGKAISVVDTLKRLHRAMNADREVGALPESKTLASQYLFLYTLSGGDDLVTVLTPDNRVAKVVLLLHDDSTAYGRRMIEQAQRIFAEELPRGFRVRTSGTLASNGALTEVMVEGKLENILQITAITIVVASLLLRSLLAGLLVAVPLALSVALNFGVMGALGIPLDFATSAIAAMAVGIGADYAVYFLFRLREEYRACGDVSAAMERALCTSGKAIVFVSTAIAAGYSTLCLSGFTFHVQLGSLVALAMLTSSLSTLVVLSALASLTARTRWQATLLGYAPAPAELESERRVALRS